MVGAVYFRVMVCRSYAESCCGRWGKLGDLEDAVGILVPVPILSPSYIISCSLHSYVTSTLLIRQC
jgi:hypothetical protein